MSARHTFAIGPRTAFAAAVGLLGWAVLRPSLPAWAAEPATSPAASWKKLHLDFDSPDGGATTTPSAPLAPGRRGRALRVGRGVEPAEWARRGVVDLGRPGAITCWVRAKDWRPPGPSSEYVPLIRVTGAGSSALVVERDRRYAGRTIDVWVAGFFALASGREFQMQRELPTLWSDDRWHFVTFQWDATGFSLQVDDAVPARTAVAGVDLASEFPAATSTLIVGSGASEGLLVDDLTVWSRPLADREIKFLRAH